MWFADFINGLREAALELARETLRYEPPAERLRRQLRILYGSRAIDRETYLKLRRAIDRGYYIEGEIATLRRQAEVRREREGLSPQFPPGSEYQRLLERVYINRAVIDEARYEVAQALRVVEENHRWLVERSKKPPAPEIPVTAPRLPAGLSEADAQRIFGIAPVKIRHLPAQPGGIYEHLAMVEARMAAGYRELRRLDDLEEQLRVYEAELMVTQSREFLLRVEHAMKR